MRRSRNSCPELSEIPGMDELEQLRRELLHRFQANPPSTWPPELLRAVITVIDLGIKPLSNGGGVEIVGKLRIVQ